MPAKKPSPLLDLPTCECGSHPRQYELGLTCTMDVDGAFRCMRCGTVFKTPDGKPFTAEDVTALENKILGPSNPI